jgi:hypothetical protein
VTAGMLTHGFLHCLSERRASEVAQGEDALGIA